VKAPTLARAMSVNFLDGGIPIPGCSAQPVVNGVATCTTTALARGNSDGRSGKLHHHGKW